MKAAIIGAGIGGMVLWPNAGFVLDALGLLDAVAAAGGRVHAMHRLDRTGVRLQSLDVGRLDAAMGYPSHAILRRDLVQILGGWLAGHGVPLVCGASAPSLHARPSGPATLLGADGRAIDADLILGADGRMASVALDFVTGDNRSTNGSPAGRTRCRQYCGARRADRCAWFPCTTSTRCRAGTAPTP